MTLEERLAALEAEVRALRQLLGQTPSREPPVLTPPGSAEVRLASYWVTRVGAVLILLGAIFLAAYLSVYSSAPIRVGELAAAASVALAIAYWQQRRGHLAFALVLHSLGDALLFFTAFAAYAFGPTRVIHTVEGAIAAQTLAGLFVGAHAVQRRSEGSATFSLVLLAWVAGFSLLYQHSETTLGYGVAITLIAAILRLRWGWNQPLLFAAVAAPLITAWLAQATVFDPDLPHLARRLGNGALQAPLEFTWAVLPLLVAAPAALSAAALTWRDRGVVLTGTVMAILAGLYARYGLAGSDPDQLLREAVAVAAIAGLFAVRAARPDPIRRGLIFQHLFLTAVTTGLYLVALRPSSVPGPGWLTALAILTAADAALLRWTVFPARAQGGAVLLAAALLATLYAGWAEAELSFSATFVWVPLAAGTFLLGFWRPNANLRVAALIAFGACIVRLFVSDLNTSATRIAASLLLGVVLLGIGYLYSRLHRPGA